MISLARKLTRPAAIAGAVALAIPVATATIAPAPAVAQSAAGLDAAVAALRGISTMQANFVQTDERGQRLSGTMTLKRPGKIRFQYQKGVPLLIVSDGKAFTMVDYEVNQVQRWPISNSPLGALLDPNRDVKRYGKLQRTGNSDVLSVEVEDKKKPEFGTITLVFLRDAKAPGGWRLNSWVARDAQNKQTSVRLSGHKYGVSVSNNMFRYKDPRPSNRR